MHRWLPDEQWIAEVDDSECDDGTIILELKADPPRCVLAALLDPRFRALVMEHEAAIGKDAWRDAGGLS